jgi:hypothetical protein
MSEFGDSTPDFTVNDYIELLPKKCRDCNFARLVLSVAYSSKFEDEQPPARIVDIELNCTGYQGPIKASEAYSPNSALDQSGCPYLLFDNERTGS